MIKSTNARLVFTRLACALAAISLMIILYAACPAALGQQALPDDWPQTISVPGMEKVTGLVQGENNLSYSINIISEDSGKINFQVNAFCVYNPASDYAMLHILEKPLPGVVDQDKKTLQIDFSPLDSGGLKSVSIIDKADVSKVLMQDKSSLVLNTALSVDSMDESQVRFSISDMSIMQPDGVLNDFSLPEPVPAYYSPETDRFSTVAFDEMANVMQQNYVLIQQNTYVNVVNIVNEVNVINVVGFGGYGGWGCGWGGGVPYGGYGCGDYGGYGGYGGYGDYYGGYGGYGGYGDYGGYGGYGGGYAPYCDPLPLAPPGPVPPLGIPDDVPVYRARHSGMDDRMPIAERRDHGGRYADAGGGFGDRGYGAGDSAGRTPGDRSRGYADDTGRMAPGAGTAAISRGPMAADNSAGPAFSQRRPDMGGDRAGVRSTGNPDRRTSDISTPAVSSVSDPAMRVARPDRAVAQGHSNTGRPSNNVRPADAPVRQTSAKSAPAVRQASSGPTKKVSSPSRSLDQARPAARTAPASVKSAGAPAMTGTDIRPAKQAAPRQGSSYKSSSPSQTVRSPASSHKATSVQRSPAVSASKAASVKQAPATMRAGGPPSKQTVTRPAAQTVRSPASSHKATSVQRAPQASSPRTSSMRQAPAPARAAAKSQAPKAPSHAVSRPSSSGGGRKR